MRAVAREHSVAVLAVRRLQAQAASNPGLLIPAQFDTPDVTECLRNLDRTYMVRICSEFEAALRDFWKSPLGMRRRTEPPAESLINSIGARRAIDASTLLNTHRVREYRNDLVHVSTTALVLTLEECRSFLHHFVSYLPPQW